MEAGSYPWRSPRSGTDRRRARAAPWRRLQGPLRCALHHEEQTAVLSAKQIGHAAVPAPDARGLVLPFDGYVDSRGSKLGHHLKNGSGKGLGRSGFEPLKA
jgi:hypothetical protein